MAGSSATPSAGCSATPGTPLNATNSAPARSLVASAPEVPVRARAVAGGAAIEVDDPFDRAWRRVGLALDRSGFTVEDRERAQGMYCVRYVDAKNAGKDEPSCWARLLGASSNPQAAIHYRIAVKGSGDKTLVAVLTSAQKVRAWASPMVMPVPFGAN